MFPYVFVFPFLQHGTWFIYLGFGTEGIKVTWRKTGTHILKYNLTMLAPEGE